jgi:DNA-directed RNA polymerase specialized sigma24 family protein
MVESTEEILRRDWDARAYDRVATRAIDAYGAEIVGVLAVQLRSSSDAHEAYSMFIEDLWRGLPDFQWRCSFRAWAHKLARNAGARWVKAGARRPERNIPLSNVSDVSAVAARARTSTAVHLRTEVRSAVTSCRTPIESCWCCGSTSGWSGARSPWR